MSSAEFEVIEKASSGSGEEDLSISFLTLSNGHRIPTKIQKRISLFKFVSLIQSTSSINPIQSTSPT